MTLPINANVVRVRGYWYAQDGGGADRTITATPTASNLTDMGAFGYIKTAVKSTSPHPSTGAFFLDLLATDDPDLTPFAWTIKLEGEQSFTVEVPHDSAVVDVGAGLMMRAAWLVDLATTTPPTPVNTYYTSPQTDAAIVTALADRATTGFATSRAVAMALVLGS